MKKAILWVVLLAVAIIFKILQPPYEIGWRVDPYTHRGVNVGDVIFWSLLIIVEVLVLVELAHRWRSGMLR